MVLSHNDDIILAVVDTEGHIGNMHQACVRMLSLRELMTYRRHGRADYDGISMKFTPTSFATYAHAIMSKMNAATYIVAHNLGTDRNNIVEALKDAELFSLIPANNKWIDSKLWAQAVSREPNSKFIKSSDCSMNSLNAQVLGEPFRNRHTARGDATVLTRILERMFLEDTEMFIKLMPLTRSKADLVRSIRGTLPALTEAESSEEAEEPRSPSSAVPSPRAPTQEPVTDVNVMAGNEAVQTEKEDEEEIQSISFLNDHIGEKVAGPFSIRCDRTINPVTKHYIWAWSSEEPLRGVPTKKIIHNTSINVLDGQYIEVISGERRVSYVDYRLPECFGVYNVKEKILRVFRRL